MMPTKSFKRTGGEKKSPIINTLIAPPRESFLNTENDIIISYSHAGSEKKEKEYISPNKVSKESITKIKKRNQKIGSLFTGRFDKFVA